MFFGKLSLRQKNALLAMAKRMMIADSKVKPEEDIFFNILRSELGPKTYVPADEVYGEIDVSMFDDSYSRLVLLMTLAIMAYVDDSFHPKESSVLAEVIQQIGFADDIVAEAMSIAETEGNLIKQVQGLFARAG